MRRTAAARARRLPPECSATSSALHFLTGPRGKGGDGVDSLDLLHERRALGAAGRTERTPPARAWTRRMARSAQPSATVTALPGMGAQMTARSVRRRVGAARRGGQMEAGQVIDAVAGEIVCCVLQGWLGMRRATRTHGALDVVAVREFPGQIQVQLLQVPARGDVMHARRRHTWL